MDENIKKFKEIVKKMGEEAKRMREEISRKVIKARMGRLNDR